MSSDGPSTGSGSGRQIAPSGYTGPNNPPQGQGSTDGSTESQQPDGGARDQNQASASSSGPGAGSGGNAPQNPLPDNNPVVQRMLADCEGFVDQYRRQRISKGKALHEIHKKLAIAAAGGTSFDVEGAFSSFLRVVEDCDQQDENAADRGRALASAHTQGGAPAGARRSPSPRLQDLPGGRSSALEVQYPWANPSAFLSYYSWIQKARNVRSSLRRIAPSFRTLSGPISSTAVRLTDFYQFFDIKTAVVDSIGVGVVGAQRESNAGAARKPKTEACNNWNNGRCTADAGTCRRLHICNVCRVSGHKGPDCPERPKN